MRVPVCTWKAADTEKLLPASFNSTNQSAVGLEYAIRIFWIDNEPAK